MKVECVFEPSTQVALQGREVSFDCDLPMAYLASFGDNLTCVGCADGP